MTETVRPVILSGGSGTRLWPLSRETRPKQFIELLGEPLFAQALARLEDVAGVAGPLIVTGVSHLDLVSSALADAGIEPFLVLSEPEGRNTAPATVAAALTVNPDEILVVLPSDHLIADRDGFTRSVETAVRFAASGHLVTFGVVPHRPETGYGYIEVGEDLDGASRVVRFIEKPDRTRAREFVAGSRHLWNSGMFVFQASALLEEARRFIPEIVSGVEEALVGSGGRAHSLGPAFARVESISIDHAVMERTEGAVVVPIDVGWNDVGSWQSMWEIAEKDGDDNVLIGDVMADEVSGSYIRSTTRRVGVAGVRGIVVVETDDAILVVGRDHTQLVRGLAERDAETTD